MNYAMIYDKLTITKYPKFGDRHLSPLLPYGNRRIHNVTTVYNILTSFARFNSTTAVNVYNAVIADLMKVSTMTVKRCMADLESIGLIHRSYTWATGKGEWREYWGNDGDKYQPHQERTVELNTKKALNIRRSMSTGKGYMNDLLADEANARLESLQEQYEPEQLFWTDSVLDKGRCSMKVNQATAEMAELFFGLTGRSGVEYNPANKGHQVRVFNPLREILGLVPGAVDRTKKRVSWRLDEDKVQMAKDLLRAAVIRYNKIPDVQPATEPASVLFMCRTAASRIPEFADNYTAADLTWVGTNDDRVDNEKMDGFLTIFCESLQCPPPLYAKERKEVIDSVMELVGNVDRYLTNHNLTHRNSRNVAANAMLNSLAPFKENKGWNHNGIPSIAQYAEKVFENYV